MVSLLRIPLRSVKKTMNAAILAYNLKKGKKKKIFPDHFLAVTTQIRVR